MLKNIALKIALIYFVVGTLWILISDHMVMLLVSDPAAMTLVNSFKGVVFIIVTTLCLYIAAKIYLTKLENANRDLEQRKAELKAINENLVKMVQEETQKRLESEKVVIQQSRLAMMGEMLSAIAHHWRQPLNAVGIRIQDIYMAFQNSDVDDEYVRNFKDSAMSLVYSMSKMIDNFRYFFVESDEKEEFSIEDIIDKTMLLMSAKLENTGIDVFVEYDEEHRKNFYGFAHEFKYAMLNIIANAVDAALDNKSKVRSFIKIKTEYQDNVARIYIEDSGGGIGSEIRSRMYEPYYTTKEQDGGSGIGLYMSKEIIERQMHGKLYDKEGEFGAVFVVELSMA